jgi:phosphomannomutase
MFRVMRTYRRTQDAGLSVGFVFDGDSDRIAAVDGQGNFLSSQVLIPILIEHLAVRRGLSGEVVKTVSGSDLMPRVAALHNLSVHETAVGYKYIADRMLSHQVLLGGEESGGIGYGTHIPERDALLSALYLLEAIAQSGLDLSDLYKALQVKTGFNSAYDRIDLHLSGMEVRSRLIEQLQSQPLTEIAGQAVVDCNTIDGYKFRLADGRWLMIRFSGTEPVLRLYCEAPTLEQVHQTLNWAKNWANSV